MHKGNTIQPTQWMVCREYNAFLKRDVLLSSQLHGDSQIFDQRIYESQAMQVPDFCHDAVNVIFMDDTFDVTQYKPGKPSQQRRIFPLDNIPDNDIFVFIFQNESLVVLSLRFKAGKTV